MPANTPSVFLIRVRSHRTKRPSTWAQTWLSIISTMAMLLSPMKSEKLGALTRSKKARMIMLQQNNKKVLSMLIKMTQKRTYQRLQPRCSHLNCQALHQTTIIWIRSSSAKTTTRRRKKRGKPLPAVRKTKRTAKTTRSDLSYRNKYR